jgi:phosphopantothenoylcysteine decarboxylase/phosphopantothenate--cysteine ligase
LVGFKAETTDAIARGRKMLAAKHLDLVVVNEVGKHDSGFETDTNRAVILGADGAENELPLMTKSQVARVVCDRIAAILRAH